LILRGKEGRSRDHMRATGSHFFTDHLLTLSKDVTHYLSQAGSVLGGHHRGCDFLIKAKAYFTSGQCR